jgi:solute carrier family 25 S-adenosylmethionine transporter 26
MPRAAAAAATAAVAATPLLPRFEEEQEDNNGYQFDLCARKQRQQQPPPLVSTAASAAASSAAGRRHLRGRRSTPTPTTALGSCSSSSASRTVPLASLTLSSAPLDYAATMTTTNTTTTTTRPMPLFVIAAASAAEPKAAARKKKSSSSSSSSSSPAPPPPPAWRVTLGNLLAGGTAGCAVEAALYPIDTVKTRLQAAVGGGGMRALMQSGGGRGLYAGVWGNLAGVLPSSALFMAVYEPVKQAVYARRDLTRDEAEFWGPVVAGMAAGLAASLTRVPTEVVKQRLQTGEFRGALGAVRHIVAREGVRRGLYAGYGAFLLRDLPFDAIEFVAYERLKLAAAAALGREPNAAEVSAIGAAAGGLTGVVTTPLDVLKTRLMTQGASGAYKGVFDAAVGIVRTEGWGAMMAGWQPRLIWISLGGCVFFPCLEAAKRAFCPGGQTGYGGAPVSTELVVEELEARDFKRAAGGGRESGF